jgi:hypothetical protein
VADIPTHARWMKDTYSLTRPRSDPLKKLDAAIAAHDKDKKEAPVKKAYDDWRFDQSRKGQKWRESVRNEKGAMSNLWKVFYPDTRKLTTEDLEGMRWAREQQRLALAKQFASVTLTPKPGTKLATLHSAGTTWEKFKNQAKSVQSGKDAVGLVKDTYGSISKGVDAIKSGGKEGAFNLVRKEAMPEVPDFVKKLCGDLPRPEIDQIFSFLGLGSMDTFVANVAPFFGSISSGKKAILGWCKVAVDAWKEYDSEKRRFAFAPGDPESAFDAVLKLLHDAKIAHAKAAGVATGAFALKLGLAFVDAGAVSGPVVGAAETLAELCQTIYDLVQDWKELKAANNALRVGPIDFRLFEISPVLGCYFLVMQDHSTIINYAVADWGSAGFVLDVQRLVKAVEPVLQRAREFIFASPFEIVDFRNAKGVVGGNWKTKSTLGKVVSLKEHVQGEIEDKVDSFLGLSTKPKVPKVDKSRIIGYGGYVPGGAFGYAGVR